MKKLLVILGLSLAIISCDKSQDNVSGATLKTAYVDTGKLGKEYLKAKDLEAKYKSKQERISQELDSEVKKFQAEVEFFQKNAQAKGMDWARKTEQSLMEKEQRLTYAQQAMLQQLQAESGQEMDSLVTEIKKFIQVYGKDNGYDYIYGANEVGGSVLYAKEQYDITNEIIKVLNDKYKAESKESDEVKIEKDSVKK